MNQGVFLSRLNVCIRIFCFSPLPLAAPLSFIISLQGGEVSCHNQEAEEENPLCVTFVHAWYSYGVFVLYKALRLTCGKDVTLRGKYVILTCGKAVTAV